MVPAPLSIPFYNSLAVAEPSPPLTPAYSASSSSSSQDGRGGTVSSLSSNAAVTVAIIGVGFVGSSLLREFGTEFRSIGYDISSTRIQELHATFKTYEKVTLTSNETDLALATHYLIAVPTLLRQDRSVNLDYVLSSVHTVLKYARPGATIVIESSVSVGTTRQILGPYRDLFHCGMSPERVDPGRVFPKPVEIPKIVSGLTPNALKSIGAVYGKVFKQVVPVSSCETAEMTKLFENCYRMVNIAYVNEMSDACRAHRIDPTEMISAAATKPYGYQPFWPGLGIGGHCIPVNPFYLFANNKNLPVLERATKQMWARPRKLATKFHRRCLTLPSKPRDCVLPRVLVVGMGFKPGQSVLSCSPGVELAKVLREKGCERLAFYDPLVDQDDLPWLEKLEKEAWTAEQIDEAFDGLAICMHQNDVDFSVVDRLRRTFVRSFA
ncbi:MAG: hypothetical protein M1828_004605 [Chrysothrix sp. TS-e1954]|nr:MAG: hypothetical protein M1828_004605 [Chrysothrix sp. TS-e1954]